MRKKSQQNRKKCLGILCGFFLLVSLTSCGRQEVDYVDPVSGSEQTSAETESGTEIPERMEETLTSDTGGVTVKIDADIQYDSETVGIPVVKISPDPFSEEDMEFYAERLFDDGTEELWPDAQFLTRDMLLERKQELEAELDNYTEKDYYLQWLFGELDSVDSELSDYQESDERGNWEKPKYFRYFFYKDENGTIIAENTKCSFRGTIDGSEYLLTFQKAGDATSMHFCSLHREVDGAYTPAGPESPLVAAGNLCKFSKEEAEQLACDFINSMEIQDFVPVAVLDAKSSIYLFESQQIKDSLEAYQIYFGRSVKGLSTIYSDEQSNVNQEMITVYDESGNAIENKIPYEWIRVTVTDDGIVEMTYQSPMKVEEISTEQAVLLPFDAIQERAREYLREKYLTDTMSYEVRIDLIEFGLERVEGADGSFTLVPAWSFLKDDQDDMNYMKYTLFTINAIDGSLIESE